jgi:predicted nucleic acid-binding protein
MSACQRYFSAGSSVLKFVGLVAQALKEKTGLPWRYWGDLVVAAQTRRVGTEEIYSNDIDFDRIPESAESSKACEMITS